tara:strand:- start:4044 stop:4823 length:780 start_codon:yes stop_codon:yes gene_type:complete
MKIDTPQFNLMHRACMKASKILIRDFGEIEKLQILEKGPGDFVTASDKKVEKVIINELLITGYSILSEESGLIDGKNPNKRWVIDPIDGTTNFSNGLSHFAISIGYEENKEIISGVIFDPIKNEMFMAHKGLGSYLNNSRIRVSNKSDIKNSMLVTGGPRYLNKTKEKIFSEYEKISKSIYVPIRKSGSAALDLAYVAAGRYDGMWQRDLNYWDVAAGIIIIKESGGFINNLKSEDFFTGKLDIIASNTKIYDDLSKFL